MTGESPAKLGTARKFGQESWIADTDKSDELAARGRLAGFDGPEAEVMGGPVFCDERVERGDGCGVDRPVEVPGDFGVLVDRRHQRLVCGSPAPQAQPWGEEFIHRARRESL